MINDYEATKPMTSDAEPIGDRTMSNDDIVSTLNSLIETCKDGEFGFNACAKHTSSSELRSLFLQRAAECKTAAAELQRGWMDIKSAVTRKDEKAILNECERGEDSARNTYKDALKEPLPTYIAEVVKNQFDSIVQAHDRVKGLRDSFKEGDTRSSTASTSY